MLIKEEATVTLNGAYDYGVATITTAESKPRDQSPETRTTGPPTRYLWWRAATGTVAVVIIMMDISFTGSRLGTFLCLMLEEELQPCLGEAFSPYPGLGGQDMAGHNSPVHTTVPVLPTGSGLQFRLSISVQCLWFIYRQGDTNNLELFELFEPPKVWIGR